MYIDALNTESWSLFIKERLINDSYLNAMEILTSNKNDREKGILFKIHFEKAFDNIDWRFLITLLEAKGFGSKWCKWIISILHSSKMAILIIGEPTIWIQARKGLKQGDSLSPLLFALVAKINCLLKLIARNNMIRGIGPLNTIGSILSL